VGCEGLDIEQFAASMVKNHVVQGGKKTSDGAGAAVGAVAPALAQSIAAGKKVVTNTVSVLAGCETALRL
jgi:hypothetical protein